MLTVPGEIVLFTGKFAIFDCNRAIDPSLSI